MHATHHVEEDVEGVRLPRVRRDEADEGDEVERGGLDQDRGFFRKTERLARVANRVLAHPDAVGDQHCNARGARSINARMGRDGEKKGRTRAESVDGDGRAEERLADLLLLLNEDRVTFGEPREALDGRDTSSCTR